MLNCNYCQGENVIRHGKRSTRNGPVQIYLCRDCGRVFSNNPIPHLNTRSLIILRGSSLYCQGYSLAETSKMLEKAFNEKVPRNTIHYWTKRYGHIYTYLQDREKKEKRSPLLPRVYGKKTFSLHRNKVDRLPEYMGSLVGYLYHCHRGLEKEYLGNSSFMEMRIENVEPYLKRREYHQDTPETKIAALAEMNDETDPVRSILITERTSLCRNLPLYKKNKGQGPFYDHVDLLQYDKGTVTLVTYMKDLEEIDVMKHLVISGRALIQITHLDPSFITLGAFDTEKKWTLPLPILVKRTLKSPKDN